MKVLKADYEYYYYPEEIDNFSDLLQYLNDNYNKFIPLVHFLEDNCLAPYFVQEDVTKVYLNVGQINLINEEEVTVLSRKEYDERLKKVIASKCVGCTRYEEDSQGEDLKDHRNNISLDGECSFYEKIEQDDWDD